MKYQDEFLAPFLSEAVEASGCYFFQNWLMKLKIPNYLKPLDTIIQENYQLFYPSEPFRITRFKMRHPVIRTGIRDFSQTEKKTSLNEATFFKDNQFDVRQTGENFSSDAPPDCRITTCS